MTAKSKAIQLLQAHTNVFLNNGCTVNKNAARESALVTINEFLRFNFFSHGHQQKEFWKEVKIEIEKL